MTSSIAAPTELFEHLINRDYPEYIGRHHTTQNEQISQQPTSTKALLDTAQLKRYIKAYIVIAFTVYISIARKEHHIREIFTVHHIYIYVYTEREKQERSFHEIARHSNFLYFFASPFLLIIKSTFRILF